ncbi:hypothetical protein [Marinirhabdus gelatinilytica]|uniref:Putative flap endonuclease-1-like 5' DNA nuclease n=1 Tax=Marinirhabdus gelatinilytica TaxID=1703343 RepID=A0A370QAF6_9FLAO|nr:hypothetical protein [Marinirhabdus gelatinilytica]RDK85279.1 putative flap endonuclease-1-like 5' DNA nuclease [Marinirhabdus gelatinilytica]
MEALVGFVENFGDYIGIFLLMLSSFLLGYFSASQLLRNKYRKIINRLKREVNALKTPPRKDVQDIETIFTEIKPKIISVVKEQQEIFKESNAKEAIAEKFNFAEKNKEKYQAILEKSIEEANEEPELDFDSFGYADASDKEDLTKINGIGPYIEQKLNDIGIYTYDQISKLSQQDVELITEMIDFFPGRIERDNWVGQAKSLNVY